MIIEERDNVKQRTVVEKHTVLVQEPESKYVVHFAPWLSSVSVITQKHFKLSRN